MASIRIENLTKSYGNATVVQNLSLEIKEGEFLTLLGPSGCGKTTTLRCIAGLERPTSGTISIGGKVVVGPGTFMQPDRRGLGMVFQSYALWPHMSVEGNVSYPLKRAHVASPERKVRTQKALETVGLGHLAARSVGTLSGGQQQRVALARAIVAEPPLVLFDEPLSNLDARLRSSMRMELQMLSRRLGTTSVYVTHDQLEALTLSDRIVVLNEGAIQQIGTPEEIYSFPANQFVADFLGFENLLHGVVASIDAGVPVVSFGAAGMLTLPNEKSWAVGDRVCVAVRASSATITDGDSVRGGLKARITARTFLGDQTEFIADADGQNVVIQMASNSPIAAATQQSDTVTVHFSGNKFNLFPVN